MHDHFNTGPAMFLSDQEPKSISLPSPSVVLEGSNPPANTSPVGPITLNSLQLIHLYVFNYISGSREQVDSNHSAFAWKTQSPSDLNIRLKRRSGVGGNIKQNKNRSYISRFHTRELDCTEEK